MLTKNEPGAGLQKLGRLVGTWKLSGDTSGTVRYEWMEGGFFLVQQVNMSLFGKQVRATEIIGRLQPFGEPPSDEIHSRAYDSNGNTLDYIYELEGDTLTIWGGRKGSPACFKGVFNPEGNQSAGTWTYPGGGYRSDMTRVVEE